MAFKFIAVLAFVAVASAIEYPGYQHHSSHGGQAYEAAPVYHAAPVHYAAPAVVKSSPVYHAAPVYKHVEHVEHEAPPKYDFSYSVHDTETGDIKQQQESRDGDVVHGSYSLYDADGHHRVVEYTADDHNGFNAVVRREPTGHKVVAAPVHKVVAPVHKIVAAPAVYHAEPKIYQHQAPVAHYTAPVVTKVVSHAPVAHYAAPVAHYAAPVAHYAAPVSHEPAHSLVCFFAGRLIHFFITCAAIAHEFSNYEPAHVSYNGPSSNYHY